MNSPILLAYGFDGKGGGKPLASDAISKQLKDDSPLAWVHLDANHPETRTWLKREVTYLDLFIIEALLEDETRPRMTQIDSGVLLILRGVNLNTNASPEDMLSIRLWVDKHRIISLRKKRLKSIKDIEDKIHLGKGPRDAGQFLCMLVSQLFERMNPVLSGLDETMDDIEEEILENADALLSKAVVDVRKKAIIFRRYMSPQRDAILQLLKADVDWLDDDTHKYQLKEAHNHAIRYVEDLDAVRERSQVVKDELLNILADRTNRNMYIFSIIASVFLPLGFLTGLLGINVGGIPGSENPNAFYIFCMILVALVGVQIFLFKKMKWF